MICDKLTRLNKTVKLKLTMIYLVFFFNMSVMSNIKKPIISIFQKPYTVYLKNSNFLENNNAITKDVIFNNKTSNYIRSKDEIDNNLRHTSISNTTSKSNMSINKNLSDTQLADPNIMHSKVKNITNWIKEFNLEISPVHIIYTYFSDPFKSHIVYLFIETSQQKLLCLLELENHNILIDEINPITPFTCNIEEELDKLLIKTKLYEISSNNNLVYNYCFRIEKFHPQDILYKTNKRFCTLFNYIFNLCYGDILELVSVISKTGKIFNNKTEWFKLYHNFFFCKQSVVEHLKDFFSISIIFLNINSCNEETSCKLKSTIESAEKNGSVSKNIDFNANYKNCTNSYNYIFKNNTINNTTLNASDVNKNSRKKYDEISTFKNIKDLKNVAPPDLEKVAKYNVEELNFCNNSCNFKLSNYVDCKDEFLKPFLNTKCNKNKLITTKEKKFTSNLNSAFNFKNRYTTTIIPYLPTTDKNNQKSCFLPDVQKLLLYLQSWPIRHLFFFEASLIEKLNYIQNLSKKIYFASRRHCTSSEIFNKFTLYHIRKIHNKFDKLTLFLIFTKIIKISNPFKPKYKFCELFVLSWVYLNYKPQNDSEQKDLLQAIYLTINNNHVLSKILFDDFKVKCLHITTIEQMKLNFMNRILLMYFNEDRIFRYTAVPAWQFQILWRFMVYMVHIKFQLFEF